MQRKRGFTLIELLITIAIAAILLGLAAPNLRDFIINNRRVTQTNDVLSDLAFARAEAAKSGRHVVICSTTTPGGATATCDGPVGDWAQGRLIWLDFNGDNALNTADGDIRIRTSTNLEGSNRLVVNTVAGNNYVFYRSSGISSTSGTFTICDPNTSSNGREITIAVTGRASVTDTAANCP